MEQTQLMLKLIVEVFEGLLVSAIILAIGKSCAWIVRLFQFPSRKFKITGFWFAEHGSDFDPSVKAIEIYWFSQSGERVKYQIEQYISLRPSVFRFCGYGILRAGKGATYYYSVDRNSEQIGIMDFSITKLTAAESFLKATFREIDHRKPVCKNGNSEDYRIYPLNLSLKQKIKFKLLHKTFDNFSDVEKYIEKFKNE